MLRYSCRWEGGQACGWEGGRADDGCSRHLSVPSACFGVCGEEEETGNSVKDC